MGTCMIAIYSRLLVQGAATTLGLWLAAGSISLTIGLGGGILVCSRLRLGRLQQLIGLYVFFARGIPAYVQLLIAYFVLPSILHVAISPAMATLIALGLCSGGYAIEIIRSGINAVPLGQWEAATVLGYSQTASLRYIILPQALRIILPALIGEYEQLLKSTALAATIGVFEITRTGMNIVSREFNPISVYMTIAIIYLLFSAGFNGVGRIIQQFYQQK